MHLLSISMKGPEHTKIHNAVRRNAIPLKPPPSDFLQQIFIQGDSVHFVHYMNTTVECRMNDQRYSSNLLKEHP